MADMREQPDKLIERALARACAASDRVKMPRRVGDTRWTAQVVSGGIRRMGIVSHQHGMDVGMDLGDMRRLPAECRRATAAYIARTSPRLRRHRLELVGEEVLLVGHAGADADEPQIAELLLASVALSGPLAEQIEGLRDARIARAYLAIHEGR